MHKSEKFKNKKCPHDAVPGSDYCIWHQKKDGKDFSGQKIEETDLIEAYLVKANLKGTKLKYAKLQGANLYAAKLQGADLQKVDLQGAKLYATNLQGANLWYTKLIDAEIGSTNLNGANLEYAKLQWANLRKASIKFAILKDADLDGTLMNKGTDLTCTFLNGADLKNAKKLQYARVNNICVEEIVADILDNVFYEMSWPSYNKIKYKKVFSKYLKEYLENQCRDYINDRMDDNKHVKEIPENFLEFIVNTIFSEKININNSKMNKGNDDINKPFLFSRCEQIGIRLKFYNYARDVYVNLKNYFKNAGLYDKSSKFFIGEYRVRVKMNKLSGDMAFYELHERISSFFNKLTFQKHRKEPEPSQEKSDQQESKKFWVLIGDILTNYFLFSMNRILSIISLYGESVWRVIFTAFSIILIYASIYSLGGSIIGTDMAVPIHNFWTNLYFSIVTFTTLGYGDLHPVSSTFIRMIAGSEAFLGAFILAYFVVVVSRKIMR